MARELVNVYLRELHSNGRSTKNATQSGSLSLHHSIMDVDDNEEGEGRDGGGRRRDRSSYVVMNSVVKSNALLVLGDLCVRYTNLVDRHIGTVYRPVMCLANYSATRTAQTLNIKNFIYHFFYFFFFFDVVTLITNCILLFSVLFCFCLCRRSVARL